MKIEKRKITRTKILTSFLSGLMKFVEKKPFLSAIAETIRSLGEYEMDQIDDALVNATREDIRDVLNGIDVDTGILLVIKDKLDAQRENIQDRLDEQEKQIAERFSGFITNMREAVNDISTIKDAVLGRFVTLQQQEEFFWHNVINEKAIPVLMEKIGAEGKKYLRETFIGREKEQEDFRLFLQGGGHGAFCLEGDPGCGKSRFLIECAGRAEKDGWKVYFIPSKQSFNLAEFLQSRHGRDDRVLIIWDDWKGEYPELFKSFLELHENQHLSGWNIRRVLATWRNYHQSLCGSKPKEPGIPFEIKTLSRLNCDSDKEIIIEYIRNVISFSGGAAPGSRIIEHVAGISDGNPRYMIYGINLVLEGKDVLDLADAESVLGSSYSLIFNKLIKDHGEQVFESYIKLALIGATGASELETEEIDIKIGNFEKHRQILVQEGYLFYNSEAKIFLVDPDLLRIYVTRLFISNNTDSPLWSENPVGKMRRFLRPFLPRWLGRILPLLNSLRDNEKSAKIKRALLEDAGNEIDENNTSDEERLEGWMNSLAVAHWIERDNEDRKPVLKLLEKTANKTASPSAELDRIWAMVMVNEAAAETDPGKCLETAREIAAVANRHARPVPKIDTAWAMTLVNATAVETDSGKCLDIAREITAVANRHTRPVPEIDTEWAKALFNATVSETDPDKCLEIAREIAAVANRHTRPIPEIDTAWAKALYNSTVIETDPGKCLEIAREIAEVANRHTRPVPEIDTEWAKALALYAFSYGDSDIILETAERIKKGSSAKYPEISPGLLQAVAALIYQAVDREQNPDKSRQYIEWLGGNLSINGSVEPLMLKAFIDTLLLQLKKNISNDERKAIITNLIKLGQTFEIDLPAEIERRDDDAGSDDET